jgi:cystathionine gamma-lyase
MALAGWLERHPAVARVSYPGLPSHPQHALARRQMAGFGGMLNFWVRGGLPAARRFLETVRIFACAESLGGVESLIEHPARMTHASTQEGPTAAPRNLIRLSVGIESAEDLIADLEAALVRTPTAA